MNGNAPRFAYVGAYRQIERMLGAYRRLLLMLVVVTILLVAMEGLGLGLALLMLGAGSVTDMAAANTRLAALVGRFPELPVVTRIQMAALALVAITLARGALQYAQHLLALRLRRSVECDLQVRVFGRLHTLPLSTLQRERAGGLLTVLGPYPRQVGQLALQSGRAVAGAVVVLAYLGAALLLSWPLTLLAAALLAPVALLLRPLLGARLRRASRRTRDLMKQAQNVAQEHLAGMKVIRLFNRAEWSQGRFADALDALHAQEYRAGALSGLSRPLFNLLNGTALAALMLAGAALLPESPEALPAQLALFLVIAFRLMGPLGDLTGFQASVTQTGPMLEAIFTFLDEANLPALPDGDTPFRGLRQGVTLDCVTFRYAPDESPVLQDVTLHISKGQLIAVVGASGAGKSTLVNLITRLYDPTAGRVCVDGVDLREMQIASWRARVAVVSQDVFLFHASVRDSLRFARPDADAEEIMSAARVAQAHDFITALPGGYDTILQERGARLSGGQQQRIALARALLLDADLLILDEATSALDAPTERAMHAALEAYRRGRTALVIAHRLATIQAADWIYVLNAGAVAEQGTHAELMRLGGIYWRLAQSQSIREGN
jgi:subfamily B ATP-binding cassette protein MsbA